ncbi:MAG: phosphatase PAP2 family protein [Bacteroidetes bacterium]|nr:phosphatase PAP2 family protein [Bacteroidota bacterium]
MKNKIIVSIVLFLVLTAGFSYPQENKNIFSIIGSDINESLKDGLRVYSSPLHWGTKDGFTLGGLVLVTGAAYLKDESFRAYAGKQHSDFNDKIMDGGKMYGNLIAPVVIGGGIYSAGLFSGSEEVRVTGRMVFEAVLYSGIVTTVFKSVLGRSRPYKNEGSQFFRPFTVDNGNLSMPSGHSTVAFALSSVLSNRIHNIYASIGLYTLAGITAISRVYHDEHWASDVLLGSACGYFIGDFISSRKSNTGQGGKHSVTVYPGLGTLNLNIGL